MAVIFLPDFLDGKKQTNKEPFVSVPASPPKKPIVEPEAFPSERVAKAAQLPVTVTDDKALDDEGATSNVPSETQALPEPVEASITPEDSLASQTIVEAPDSSTVDDVGWVIQLGSFRHEKNVKSLLNKLEKAGYRAFSRRIMTNSGPLNKVFVGPDLEKQKLEAALPHLRELTDLKGKVTTFKVE
nr:SPOR domain-containing protein [Alteromonas lipotrueae]